MKLYATVTSERASKGQGGNKFISIDLAIGSAKHSNLVAKIMLDDHGFLYLRNARGEEKECYAIQNLDLVRVTDITKGKQKHDPRVCENSVPCFDCERIEKGKQQKGKKRICTFNACKNVACEESGYDICKRHFEDGINN